MTDLPVTPTRIKRESRSRKGCPECRSRKIKCDEQKPECGQCLKTGRVCRIIDSLFKPHSYSFQAGPAKQALPTESPNTTAQEKRFNAFPPPNHAQHDGKDPIDSTVERSNSTQWPRASPAWEGQPNATRRLSVVPSINGHGEAVDYLTTESVEPRTPYSRAKPNDRPIASNLQRDSSAKSHQSPCSMTTSYGEDSYQDRCEIAFFLRHFSEGPGKWMDILGGQSYFSQHGVQISHFSPLVRYAACALAAKQLGQTRHPESQIRQTNTQSLMMKALIDTKLGFTWYGAKYYERAIQLLAKEILNKDQLCSTSPHYIYGLGSTPQSTSHDSAREHDQDLFPFQTIAACVLCQYEDVSSTINAWSGHLDGAIRLLQTHLTEPPCLQVSKTLPQPTRALDAVFWFAVVNDMLNSFVTRRKPRIDPDDIVLWCKMGVPLDSYGSLVVDYQRDMPLDTILFKALVRLMCQLFNSDLMDGAKWTRINEDFDFWRNAVPISFYMPIAWPPVEEDPASTIDPFTREVWFASDTCAVTFAFYHMARMILLANRPINSPLRKTQDGSDLNSLQQDLRNHAMEIIPIMHAMPSEAVQKYMLQPLYVAGHCLTDHKERSSLLRILRDMADYFGLFTDYRSRDLCEEWGIPYDGVDRRDGHGLLT